LVSFFDDTPLSRGCNRPDEFIVTTCGVFDECDGHLKVFEEVCLHPASQELCATYAGDVEMVEENSDDGSGYTDHCVLPGVA